jgi:hypothetical protein
LLSEIQTGLGINGGVSAAGASRQGCGAQVFQQAIEMKDDGKGHTPAQQFYSLAA